jgi:hypothetical protein
MFRTDKNGFTTSFTEEEDAFIVDNYLKYPVKKLARMIGRSGLGTSNRISKLGLIIPRELIEQRKRMSYFHKGQVSFNKGMKQEYFMSPEGIERTKATRYKKGNIPPNTNYNGHERTTIDGYIEIRVSRNNYRLKHVVEWEKENYKVPKSHCLWCIDKNKKNTNHNNWELITRLELLNRNVHNRPPELKKAIRLTNKILKLTEDARK